MVVADRDVPTGVADGVVAADAVVVRVETAPRARAALSPVTVAARRKVEGIQMLLMSRVSGVVSTLAFRRAGSSHTIVTHG
jgi:hypothetical protein